jgi:hypothetical protein
MMKMTMTMIIVTTAIAQFLLDFWRENNYSLLFIIHHMCEGTEENLKEN